MISYHLTMRSQVALVAVSALVVVGCYDPVSYTHLTLPTSDLV